MKTMRVVLVVAAGSAAVFTAVLGAGSAQPSQRPAPRPSPRDIPWEHPIAQGIVTSPESAQQRGALPFRMVVPAFGMRPTETMVSDPAKVDPAHRSVGMVYRFPIGKTYPDDGRVLVLQAASQVPGEQLKAIAAHNAAKAGDHFKYLLLAGRIPAILVQDHGVGRVHLVANGVAVDITGPATSPDAVVALAEKMARQLR